MKPMKGVNAHGGLDFDGVTFLHDAPGSSTASPSCSTVAGKEKKESSHVEHKAVTTYSFLMDRATLVPKHKVTPLMLQHDTTCAHLDVSSTNKSWSRHVSFIQELGQS